MKVQAAFAGRKRVSRIIRRIQSKPIGRWTVDDSHSLLVAETRLEQYQRVIDRAMGMPR